LFLNIPPPFLKPPYHFNPINLLPTSNMYGIPYLLIFLENFSTANWLLRTATPPGKPPSLNPQQPQWHLRAKPNRFPWRVENHLTVN